MTTAILRRFFGGGRERTEKALEIIKEMREATAAQVDATVERIAQVDGEIYWFLHDAEEHPNKRPQCECDNKK